jgi:hypothetical protein
MDTLLDLEDRRRRAGAAVSTLYLLVGTGPDAERVRELIEERPQGP